MQTPVIPKPGRRLDLAGVMLLLAGAALYLRAYYGMISLEDGVAPGSPRFAGLAEFDRYWQLSRLGLWIAAAGFIVLIVSAVVTRRAARARAASVVPTA